MSDREIIDKILFLQRIHWNNKYRYNQKRTTEQESSEELFRWEDPKETLEKVCAINNISMNEDKKQYILEQVRKQADAYNHEKQEKINSAV